jgi:hypothetical protein
MLDDEPPVAIPYVAPPLLKKTAALALVKYKVPPAHAPNCKDPDVVTVAVPAVIVHVPPAAVLLINNVSPAEKRPVFTVIVVAPAAFIVIRVPLSAATRT